MSIYAMFPIYYHFYTIHDYLRSGTVCYNNSLQSTAATGPLWIEGGLKNYCLGKNVGNNDLAPIFWTSCLFDFHYLGSLEVMGHNNQYESTPQSKL